MALGAVAIARRQFGRDMKLEMLQRGGGISHAEVYMLILGKASGTSATPTPATLD